MRKATTGSGDLDWRRDMGLAARRETGTLQGYPWVLLGLAETSIHHGSRWLHRLVLFPHEGEAPLFSIDLERDILGEFCMSLNSDSGGRVLARFDMAPHHEEFRDRALAEARIVLGPDTAIPS
jgi:hypothetical protein